MSPRPESPGSGKGAAPVPHVFMGKAISGHPPAFRWYGEGVFLHRIVDSDAARAFAGLAQHLLKASGDISASEARVLFLMLGELGFGVDRLDPSEDLEVLAGRITHPHARKAALIELYRLAFADGVFKPAERDVVERIAAVWGVDAERRAALRGWVERHMALLEEGEQLIG